MITKLIHTLLLIKISEPLMTQLKITQFCGVCDFSTIFAKQIRLD